MPIEEWTAAWVVERPDAPYWQHDYGLRTGDRVLIKEVKAGCAAHHDGVLVRTEDGRTLGPLSPSRFTRKEPRR